jgi:hypothetical protein
MTQDYNIPVERQAMLDFFDDLKVRAGELAPAEIKAELTSFINYCTNFGNIT